MDSSLDSFVELKAPGVFITMLRAVKHVGAATRPRTRRFAHVPLILPTKPAPQASAGCQWAQRASLEANYARDEAKRATAEAVNAKKWARLGAIVIMLQYVAAIPIIAAEWGRALT